MYRAMGKKAHIPAPKIVYIDDATLQAGCVGLNADISCHSLRCRVDILRSAYDDRHVRHDQGRLGLGLGLRLRARFILRHMFGTVRVRLMLMLRLSFMSRVKLTVRLGLGLCL